MKYEIIANPNSLAADAEVDTEIKHFIFIIATWCDVIYIHV